MTVRNVVEEKLTLMIGEGRLIREGERCPRLSCRHLVMLHDVVESDCYTDCNVGDCECRGQGD